MQTGNFIIVGQFWGTYVEISECQWEHFKGTLRPIKSRAMETMAYMAFVKFQS